jgi:hypothetical protein
MQARIQDWIGIPSCAGIGATKTLAKLANFVAKTAERKPGSYPAEFTQACNLATLPPGHLDAVLGAKDVGEVWGVGRCITVQFMESGIHTVLDPARIDPAMARRRWSLMLERTVRVAGHAVYCAGYCACRQAENCLHSFTRASGLASENDKQANSQNLRFLFSSSGQHGVDVGQFAALPFSVAVVQFEHCVLQ